MSWRLRVCHRTGFKYQSPVVSSYNEARLIPPSTTDQLVIEADVTIDPPVPCFRYRDYWGTQVHAFDIHVPHTELAVTATTLVETADVRPPADDCGWQSLADPVVRDRFTELLAPTGYVPLDHDSLAEPSARAAAAPSPAGACQQASEWVRDRMTYEPGATTVSTTAIDALDHGRGVCQDFAHVTLAILRRAGVPARYVSGYLHPVADADVGATTTGESHAWVEAWIGRWAPFDPTNGLPVGPRHVVVSRARDYADVAPLKGIY
ncbi:MAG: transglutaminase family protein, partial [Acidimicrobiales bacterium]